jgi:hypothetical protein
MQSSSEIQEQLNVLIGRIAGLRDETIKEQCQEEYMELEEKMQIAKQQEYWHDMQRLPLLSDIQVYRGNSFIAEPNLINAIERNSNVQLIESIRIANLRVPNDLSDRHTLIRLCKHLKKRLEIKDLSGKTVDIINNSENETLIIYVYMLEEFEVFTAKHANNFAIKIEL